MRFSRCFCIIHINDNVEPVVLKGGFTMKVNGKNESIKCTIKNCAYNAQSEDYCTLDAIKVGTHEMNPTKKECTDCESFVNKAQ